MTQGKAISGPEPVAPVDDEDDGQQSRKDRHYVTSLARGLAVLRCFTADRRELGSSAIARLTKLPQPTVWRLCRTLQDEGYLLPASGDQLQLSPAVLTLGHSALASMDLTEIARPAMQAMANRFAAGCSLGTRAGLHMVLVQRCQGEAELVLNLHVGSRLPLAASTMGASYIACLGEADRAALFEELRDGDESNWPSHEKTLSEAIDEFHEHGYVTDCARYHPQINTAAVPIRTREQIYALTCGAPSPQLPLRVLRDEVGPELVQIAKALSSHRQASL